MGINILCPGHFVAYLRCRSEGSEKSASMHKLSRLKSSSALSESRLQTGTNDIRRFLTRLRLPFVHLLTWCTNYGTFDDTLPDSIRTRRNFSFDIKGVSWPAPAPTAGAKKVYKYLSSTSKRPRVLVAFWLRKPSGVTEDNTKCRLEIFVAGV